MQRLVESYEWVNRIANNIGLLLPQIVVMRKKSPIHPNSLEWVFQQFKASGRLQNYFYIPTQKN